MNKIDVFISYLVGNFDNDKQIEEELQKGKQIHPKAKHINRIINDRIKNLPVDFKNYFILEESHYVRIDGRDSSSPHLFMFYLNAENKVALKAFGTAGIKRSELRNDNRDLFFDYNELKPLEGFNDVVYEYNEDKSFTCDASNILGKDLKFRLVEKIAHDALHVLELFEKDGKFLFDFNTPIIYRRTN